MEIFPIFSHPSIVLLNRIELLLLLQSQLGCLVLHRAKRRQRGCFQRVSHVQEVCMIHKQPFPGSKNPLSHSASALSLLVSLPAAAPQQAETSRGSRAMAVLSPCLSAWTPHADDPAPAQDKFKQPPQATAQPQPNLQHREAAKLPVWRVMGLPRPPLCPEQSWLLFYSHEKLSWMVKISHSSFGMRPHSISCSCGLPMGPRAKEVHAGSECKIRDHAGCKESLNQRYLSVSPVILH